MDVASILDSLGLAYEDKGDRYLMCCPFHNEKTPSFSVYKEGGHYICFGCGVKGSIYDLVKQLSGKSLKYEKNEYAAYTNVMQTKRAKTLITDYRIEGDLFSISSNKQVQDYCWQIGLSNEFLDFFNVKYSKQFRFISKDLKEEDSKKYFYNRIIIPCLSKGIALNYECRDYTKHSGAKVLYPKGANNEFLFNFDNVDINKPVIVVEGIKGLSHVWCYYSHNVVSTFGKILKEGQKKQLLQCKHVIRMPDNDEQKIDPKTGKAVDNVALCIDEMDEFYPNEYEIAYIPIKGADPANLSRAKIKQILEARKLSSKVIMEKYNLFEVKKDTTEKYKQMLKR